jgi:hypothetical protein
MDVLSRLGATALGVSSSVTPSIAPLFLPQTRAPLTPEPLALELDEPERDGHDSHPTDARPSAIPSATTPSPASTVPRRPLLPVPSGQPVAGVTQGDASRQVGPPDGRPQSRQDQRLFRDPVRATTSAIETVRVQRRASEAAPVTPPVAPRLAQIEPAQGPAQVLQAPEISAGFDPSPSGQAAATPTMTPVRPEGQRMAEAAASLDRLRSLRETAPARSSGRGAVVRVTIGRIEVRSAPAAAPEPAVTVARPPAPARTPAPIVTLEQYLGRTPEGR